MALGDVEGDENGVGGEDKGQGGEGGVEVVDLAAGEEVAAVDGEGDSLVARGVRQRGRSVALEPVWAWV